MLTNTEQHYGLVSKTLHWSIALLIIGLIWLGWYMIDLTYFDRWYNTSLEAHKSLGMLVLALATLNITWKACNRSPTFVASIKVWERITARATHVALYIMMFLVPVTGYAISTAANSAVSFFGWFDIPAVLPASEGLRNLATEVHYYCSYGTAILVALHALAALKHQFVDEDGTLSRMF